MSLLLQIPVQMLFHLTPRDRALQQTRVRSAEYLDLVRKAGAGAGVARNVPKMMGVDEDMRDWSLFQLLEHNTIVNRSITRLICELSEGVPPAEMTRIDPKRDVMPSAGPGEEQVEAFRLSVEDFLDRVGPLSGLRNTIRIPHPVFGRFNAHQWTCMLGFHLSVHLRQARFLAMHV